MGHWSKSDFLPITVSKQIFKTWGKNVAPLERKGKQHMNDHEIFVASFDYHYALKKLSQLNDRDKNREALLIDIKCKAVEILDKYSDSIRYFAKTRRHITEW